MIICPSESFPALSRLSSLRAAFIKRCPGVDVFTDRETALARLWDVHRDTADHLGFAGMPFAKAEQVHGKDLALVNQAGISPGVDGLITTTPGICLAIYVADCAAVYIAEKSGKAIALVHSGRKGTELGIVREAITRLERDHGCPPSSLVIQLAPCIRPPHYETDFAAEIILQCRESGVEDIHDCGTCTASYPEEYYSYRREKGQTGRMLALMALLPS